MDEAFLHFIWKFQKFDTENLVTASNELISVHHPGIHNDDSGPDFSEGKLKIGSIEWSGNIEIHLKSSDWYHHQHQEDQTYENVILHVVWQHDRAVIRSDGSKIPCLELKNRVSPDLVYSYKHHLVQATEILCHSKLSEISDLVWNSNLDKMLTRRLEQKSERILTLAKEIQFDWEEVAYIALARNFGFSLNAEPFERLAKATPLKTLSKYSNRPEMIQALLFGQAGFLENPEGEYQSYLAIEYEFLKAKHGLNGLHRAHWKFGKMRPSNFPSVRLAQFSGLLSKNAKLFNELTSISSLRDLKRMFQIDLGDYWKAYYDFGKPSKRSGNSLGASSIENLTINSIAPLLSAFAIHTGQREMMDKAISLLEQLKPESNRYTKKFEALNRAPTSAFDSQAQITLFRDFCNRKKCLNCGIGISIFSK